MTILKLGSMNLEKLAKGNLICEVTTNGRFVEVHGLINDDWALVTKGRNGEIGRVRTDLLDIVGSCDTVSIIDAPEEKVAA